jgi:heat shock protein HtpX
VQARVRRFDAGLTVRMMLVGLLLTLLMVGLGGLLYFFRVNLAFIVLIEVAFLFLQAFFSDKIALLAMRAREVSEEEAPELHQMVARIAELAGIPKPRVAISSLDIPNAFATGRSPRHAVVCVTEGLLSRLTKPEVEAVLSHEVSHVIHRDVVVMTFASVVSMLAALLARMALWMGFFSAGDRDERQGGAAYFVLVELVILAASAVVYVISYLLTLALSRYRELLADRSGAILIGNPSLLKSALIKVSGAMAQIPTADLRSVSAFSAFFFAPPKKTLQAALNLLSTHPPLEVRLRKLDELEREMGVRI